MFQKMKLKHEKIMQLSQQYVSPNWNYFLASMQNSSHFKILPILTREGADLPEELENPTAPFRSGHFC